MRLPLFSALLACSACATGAGTVVLTDLLTATMPAGEASAGSGSLAPEAQTRLQASQQQALVATVRDALAAADAHPDDFRLQRRAAALVRSTADAKPRPPLDVAPLLARLAQQPCPGLADVAATRDALGDHAGAGDTYLRAARECRSVDAAIAAVAPLRQADRCNDAVVGLRAAWPLVDLHARGQTVRVLDAVASCSDEMSLRANLSFVPSDVLSDYARLLDDRARAEEQEQARAEQQRLQQEAEDRARDATWHCESECSSAESSCESSCASEPSCSQRCSALLHSCRAGCG
jgi:hypothetical protein